MNWCRGCPVESSMKVRSRKPYPTDVTDEEWAFVGPYLALLPEDAGQRRYALREVFNALRWIVRAGAPWRLLPHELPPWPVVYQQTQRWIAAGCFEALVHDLRAILRLAEGRAPEPTAVVLDGRTLQSTPESGHRAGYDGHKKKRGSKTHVAVDTLGHCWHWWSPLLRTRSGPKSRCWPSRSKPSPARASSWPTWTRATRGRRRPRRPRGMASGWRWSSTPRPSGALSCCHAAGWSNAPSPGRHASADSPATTSRCPRRWPDSTS